MTNERWIKAAPWLWSIGLFVVWEAAVHIFEFPVYILPAPSDIWGAIVKYWSPIWKNSLQTMFTTVLGFLLAVVGGLALGLAIGW
ncbi:MAG: ABC transporter permease, partial [Roseibium sp.]